MRNTTNSPKWDSYSIVRILDVEEQYYEGQSDYDIKKAGLAVNNMNGKQYLWTLSKIYSSEANGKPYPRTIERLYPIPDGEKCTKENYEDIAWGQFVSGNVVTVQYTNGEDIDTPPAIIKEEAQRKGSL